MLSNLNRKDAENLFDILDKDGSGYIDIREFNSLNNKLTQIKDNMKAKKEERKRKKKEKIDAKITDATKGLDDSASSQAKKIQEKYFYEQRNLLSKQRQYNEKISKLNIIDDNDDELNKLKYKLSIIDTFVFFFIAFVVMYIDFSLKKAGDLFGK